MLGQYIIQDVWGEPPSPIEGWTTVPAGTPTSICGGQTIIGGYNNFGGGASAKKTYTGLPGHYSVNIQFDAYFLDTWDPGEYYRLMVDGVNRYEKEHKFGEDGGTTNICGWYPADWVTTVNTGTFLHNSTTIELRFTATINDLATNEAFGFKNIQITVDGPCTAACAACFGDDISECYSCNDGWYLSGTTCVTTCPGGYWRDTSTNTCQPCYSSGTGPNYSCLTCSGGEAENCTSCSNSTFLYPNPIGICAATCLDGYWADITDSICQPCYNNTLNTSICACKTCNGPESNHCLSCFNGSFLQPDNEGHCLNTCPSSYWRDASLNKCITCNVTCQSTLVYSFPIIILKNKYNYR